MSMLFEQQDKMRGDLTVLNQLIGEADIFIQQIENKIKGNALAPKTNRLKGFFVLNFKQQLKRFAKRALIFPNYKTDET